MATYLATATNGWSSWSTLDDTCRSACTGPDDLERAIEHVARVHEHVGSRLELAVVA